MFVLAIPNFACYVHVCFGHSKFAWCPTLLVFSPQFFAPSPHVHVCIGHSNLLGAQYL